MAAFHYDAVTPAGRRARGVLEADTARAARAQVRERGLLVLDVQPVHGGVPGASGTRPARAGVRLSAREQAHLTAQLAALAAAGLPLAEVLHAAAAQASQARVRAVLAAVRARVTEGYALSRALADHPRAFPAWYRASVAAGEQSGALADVLARLAEHLETRDATRQRVLLALIYPAVLGVVAVGITAALLAFVVPQVLDVFTRTGQALPLLTRVLLVVSEVLRTAWPVLAGGLVLAGAALVAAWRRPGPRAGMERALTRVPLVGRLLRLSDSARFLRAYALLAGSGVGAVDALVLAGAGVGSVVMRAALDQAAVQVREGQSIHGALGAAGALPPLAVRLLASGERGGELPAMAGRAAGAIEQELRGAVGALLAVLEPALVLVMGAVVLLIVLAVLLPVFDLNQMSF